MPDGNPSRALSLVQPLITVLTPDPLLVTWIVMPAGNPSRGLSLVQPLITVLSPEPLPVTWIVMPAGNPSGALLPNPASNYSTDS